MLLYTRFVCNLCMHVCKRQTIYHQRYQGRASLSPVWKLSVDPDQGCLCRTSRERSFGPLWVWEIRRINLLVLLVEDLIASTESCISSTTTSKSEESWVSLSTLKLISSYLDSNNLSFSYILLNRSSIRRSKLVISLVDIPQVKTKVDQPKMQKSLILGQKGKTYWC